MPYVDPKEVMVRGQQYTFLFRSTGALTITFKDAYERIASLGLVGAEFSNPSLSSWDGQLTFRNPFVGKSVGELGKAIADKLSGTWYQLGKFEFSEASSGAPASTAGSQFQKYALWAGLGIAAVAIGFGFVQGFARGAGSAAVGGSA
jgi:hypothetical protein